MVKRTSKSTGAIDKLHENETVNEDISQILSSQTSRQRDNFLNDDLIVSLSDAYENKRERQVVEWENLGRQKLHQNQQRAA